MPNNLVFNDVANQLKTSIYGLSGTNQVQVKVTSDGSVAVTGTVNVNTVSGTVTVTATDLDIRNLNSASDNVTVTGNITSMLNVAESNVAVTSGQTGVVLPMNTSNMSMYSYYVKNTAAETLSVFLQVAPINDNAYYMQDSATIVQIAQNNSAILTAEKYLNFTRLNYSAGGATPSFEAYYNAQG